mmetsp:Transcript_43081/g.113303  ORF Transcript_43081/g.113303 Transcript_43081/m.113303 type:complete len:376 (-) Transcript_43081:108-1235(-)
MALECLSDTLAAANSVSESVNDLLAHRGDKQEGISDLRDSVASVLDTLGAFYLSHKESPRKDVVNNSAFKGLLEHLVECNDFLRELDRKQVELNNRSTFGRFIREAFQTFSSRFGAVGERFGLPADILPEIRQRTHRLDRLLQMVTMAVSVPGDERQGVKRPSEGAGPQPVRKSVKTADSEEAGPDFELFRLDPVADGEQAEQILAGVRTVRATAKSRKREATKVFGRRDVPIPRSVTMGEVGHKHPMQFYLSRAHFAILAKPATELGKFRFSLRCETQKRVFLQRGGVGSWVPIGENMVARLQSLDRIGLIVAFGSGGAADVCLVGFTFISDVMELATNVEDVVEVSQGLSGVARGISESRGSIDTIGSGNGTE